MNKFVLAFLMVFIASLSCNAEFIEDELVNATLKGKEIEKPYTNTNYNYESTNVIPIKLRISKKLLTKEEEIYDNQLLNFYVKENVKHNGAVVFNKNRQFTGIVETYTKKGMNGIPGKIIVDRFSTNGIDPNKIKGAYVKRGMDFSLIVFPIKWALTPIPGLGSCTNFIVGTNARISPRDTVTIYYYPDWNNR